MWFLGKIFVWAVLFYQAWPQTTINTIPTASGLISGSNPILLIRLVWTKIKNSWLLCCSRKVLPTGYISTLRDTKLEGLSECESVFCRRMASQGAMRGQRVVESECRCWNPAVWLLVSLLGTLVLVAVSILLRLGEYLEMGVHSMNCCT